jgi:hypothetical protein
MNWQPIVIDAVLMTSHPEQQPGEVLLTNCYHSQPEDYETISYQNKRRGLVTYDTDGRINPHMFPVFVSETEYGLRNKETTVEIGH